MQNHQAQTNNDVASESRKQPGEVRLGYLLLHPQPDERELPEVIGTEREHEDEQRIEPDHPENMFQEQLRTTSFSFNL